MSPRRGLGRAHYHVRRLTFAGVGAIGAGSLRHEVRTWSPEHGLLLWQEWNVVRPKGMEFWSAFLQGDEWAAASAGGCLPRVSVCFAQVVERRRALSAASPNRLRTVADASWPWLAAEVGTQGSGGGRVKHTSSCICKNSWLSGNALLHAAHCCALLPGQCRRRIQLAFGSEKA